MAKHQLLPPVNNTAASDALSTTITPADNIEDPASVADCSIFPSSRGLIYYCTTFWSH